MLTYNSRYWVEIRSGGHSVRRRYFFTPACRHVDESMTRCSTTAINREQTQQQPGWYTFLTNLT